MDPTQHEAAHELVRAIHQRPADYVETPEHAILRHLHDDHGQDLPLALAFAEADALHQTLPHPDNDVFSLDAHAEGRDPDLSGDPREMLHQALNIALRERSKLLPDPVNADIFARETAAMEALRRVIERAIEYEDTPLLVTGSTVTAVEADGSLFSASRRSGDKWTTVFVESDNDELLIRGGAERHPDAYEYGEPWGPDNPAPGSAWDNREQQP